MEQEIKMTLTEGKLGGTLSIDDRKYRWFVNRNYRLVVEVDTDEGGDMPDDDLQILREIIKASDTTKWLVEPIIK